MAAPVYTPSAKRAGASQMARFAATVSSATGQDLSDYARLWQWSVDQPDEFWPALWRFCDVRAATPWNQVLTDADRMPGAQWFSGATLNFAENLLRHRGDAPAIMRL